MARIAAVRVYIEGERGTLSAVVAVAPKSAATRQLQTLGCDPMHDAFCRFAQVRLDVALKGGRCARPTDV